MLLNNSILMLSTSIRSQDHRHISGTTMFARHSRAPARAVIGLSEAVNELIRTGLLWRLQPKSFWRDHIPSAS